MKQTSKKLAIVIAAIITLFPISAQGKNENRSVRKEAASAAKTLKKEGFKSLELGDMQTRLEKYFTKVEAGCFQIIGTADNCMSTNLAQVTSLANAANQYAILAGGDVRGRIVTSTSSLSGQQIDNIVSSFERLVEKELRGELVPYLTVVNDKGGHIKARVYCIVDVDSAYQLRRRALQIALEEQALAEQYGSMASSWIEEGFNQREQ